MIVRILADGQYRVDDQHAARLNAIDERLGAALDRGDPAAFDEDLARLVDLVHALGTRLDEDELRPSDAILPAPDCSVDDVRALVKADGLVPGG